MSYHTPEGSSLFGPSGVNDETGLCFGQAVHCYFVYRTETTRVLLTSKSALNRILFITKSSEEFSDELKNSYFFLFVSNRKIFYYVYKMMKND